MREVHPCFFEGGTSSKAGPLYRITPEVVLRHEEFTATTALRSGPSVPNTRYGSWAAKQLRRVGFHGA